METASLKIHFGDENTRHNIQHNILHGLDDNLPIQMILRWFLYFILWGCNKDKYTNAISTTLLNKEVQYLYLYDHK